MQGSAAWHLDGTALNEATTIHGILGLINPAYLLNFQSDMAKG